MNTATAAPALALVTDEATTVADQIEQHHQAAQRHAGMAMEHAKMAGELLQQVKSSLPHGSWLGWLKNNSTVSPRQAQRYIRAFQGRTPIKNDTVSHLPTSSMVLPDVASAQTVKPKTRPKRHPIFKGTRHRQLAQEFDRALEQLEAACGALDVLELTAIDATRREALAKDFRKVASNINRFAKRIANGAA